MGFNKAGSIVSGRYHIRLTISPYPRPMAAPNNPYPALSHAVDPAIVRSIKQASHGSGSDFGLLMAEAQQESGFRPDAKAARGSAAGMFQFTDSTWLDMVRRC